MLDLHGVTWYSGGTIREDAAMPRKAKPMPPILGVEGLSQARVEVIPDELGDESRTVVHPPACNPVDANEADRARHRAKLAASQAVLITAGKGEWIGYKPEPKLVPPHIPGMRPVGKLGEGRALYVPIPKWRRL